MNRLGLGIDAGGSSTGWLLLDSRGNERASGRTGGITGLLFTPQGGKLSAEGQLSMQRLKELLLAAGTSGRPTGVVMGAAGLESGSPQAGHMLRAIARALELPEDAVVVDNDMEIAYRGAFAPGEGILVYGGTGSIAYHVPRFGPALRVGGRGYLIDDAGGGYWIGRRALAQVLRWYDELGMPATRPLASEIYALLETTDWPAIRQHVYASGRSSVAALAPAVVRAAARGDETAAAILAEAGSELAQLAVVLGRRLGQLLPVTVSGGVTRMGDQLLGALKEGLPSGTRLQVSPDDPVRAAARLASRIRSADPSN